jgi:hypothetical protein
VKFKNELEQQTFEIARRVFGDAASIEHNKTLRIEVATSPEVASFVGPPKKEIDVITAGFEQSPDFKVLISCKEYGNSKAEPADVTGVGGGGQDDEQILGQDKVFGFTCLSRWLYQRV